MIGHIKFIYGPIDWQCLKILGYFDHGQGAEPLAQAKIVAHDLSSYAMADGWRAWGDWGPILYCFFYIVFGLFIVLYVGHATHSRNCLLKCVVQ